MEQVQVDEAMLGTVQQLGAENALLRLENATLKAVNRALAEQVQAQDEPASPKPGRAARAQAD